MNVFLRFLVRFMPFSFVFDRYIRAGADFGDAVSYIYMGECIGFADLLARWEFWEAEFARRGYRPITLNDFVAIGGYGDHSKADAKPILLGPGEKPTCHAPTYRERFLGKVRPVIDLGANRTQVGHYVIPDTEDPAPGTNSTPPTAENH